MGYAEVGGQKTYYKYKECDVGQVLVEGTFRREFEGKFGTQYEFQKDDGEIVVLNGSGQLKYKMDFVKPNSKVKVVYDGEVTLTKGKMKGKSAHQFKVYAETNSLTSVGEDDNSFDQDAIDDFDEL